MTKRGKSGFSLIELIVVIAVMAVLAAVIIPSVSGSKEAAERQAAMAAASTLNLAQSSWRLARYGTDSWPGSADQSGCYTAILPYMEYGEASWSEFLDNYPNYNLQFQNMDGTKMQKVLLFEGAGVTDSSKKIDY